MGLNSIFLICKWFALNVHGWEVIYIKSRTYGSTAAGDHRDSWKPNPVDLDREEHRKPEPVDQNHRHFLCRGGGSASLQPPRSLGYPGPKTLHRTPPSWENPGYGPA